MPKKDTKISYMDTYGLTTDHARLTPPVFTPFFGNHPVLPKKMDNSDIYSRTQRMNCNGAKFMKG